MQARLTADSSFKHFLGVALDENIASTDEDSGVALLRLDRPPPHSARVHLPEMARKRVILFADAEEEFNWHQPFRRDATATETINALPDATRRFAEYELKPTYLTDWPVVSNPQSGAIIAQLVADDACDVGTQLHPWVSPPFDEEVTTHNSYTGNLPLELQRAKLELLTHKIYAVTGQKPLVYRAGRYGIGPHTAKLLVVLGYRIDTSTRASFDYRGQGGPDFSQHPIWPWRVGGDLYEVPLTTGFTGLLRQRRQLPLLQKSHGVLARLGLLNRVPLTPEGVPINDALAAIRQLLDDGQEIFSLSFHTPSIVPGHTPYVRDAADLKLFWAWWDGVFNLFEKQGVTPIRSSELIAALDAA
jgi:hypothetical protein